MIDCTELNPGPLTAEGISDPYDTETVIRMHALESHRPGHLFFIRFLLSTAANLRMFLPELEIKVNITQLQKVTV